MTKKKTGIPVQTSLSPATHLALRILALRMGVTLQAVVAAACDYAVSGGKGQRGLFAGRMRGGKE